MLLNFYQVLSIIYCFTTELGDVGKPKLMETVEFYQKHATGTGRIELHKISVARGMTWEQSLIKFNSLIGEVNGYYLSNDVSYN